MQWPPRLLKTCPDSADQRSGNLDGTAFPVPSPAADEMQEVPQWGNMTRGSIHPATYRIRPLAPFFMPSVSEVEGTEARVAGTWVNRHGSA